MAISIEQEDAIKLALQKTVELLSNVDELYRQAAFPIILTTLLSSDSSSKVLRSDHDQKQDQEEPRKPKISSNLSIGEFLRKASPQSHKARFVCIAYFLLHSGKAEQFSVPDIIEAYNKARTPKPVNSADVIAQCIKGGLITDFSDTNSKNKTWVVTDTGEIFVEELLNGNSK